MTDLRLLLCVTKFVALGANSIMARMFLLSIVHTIVTVEVIAVITTVGEISLEGIQQTHDAKGT